MERLNRLYPRWKDGLVFVGVVLLAGVCADRAYHLMVERGSAVGGLFAAVGMGLVIWLFRREMTFRDAETKELRQILDLTGEGFAMTEWHTSTYVEVNDALCRLLGYERQELIGRRADEFVDPKDKDRIPEFAEILSRDRRAKIEITYRRKGGGEVRFLVFATALLGPGGRPDRVASFVSDISAQRQAENDAIAAKERVEAASRAKGRFLASMSHELRTPLNAIIGFSDLLLNRKMAAQIADKREEYLLDIRSSGYALMDLVGNVLDMARIEADEIDLLDQAIDLRDVAKRVIRQAQPRASTKAIVIDLAAPEPLPELYGDIRLVNRMLGNLLSNAIKFSGHAAKVSVVLRLEPNKELSIAVSDTGVGILPGAMRNIFEPFSAKDDEDLSRKEGSRLGLAVTKHLIEAHGGRIEIESEQGKGTTAKLSFPAERTALDDIS